MLEGCPIKERSAGAASFKIVMVGFCRLSLIVMKQLLAERTKQDNFKRWQDKVKARSNNGDTNKEEDSGNERENKGLEFDTTSSERKGPG